MLNYQKYKSILCLSGELPGADFFAMDLPIIAADGATNQLMNLGITPQLVIGDLDSVLPEHLEKIPHHYHYDQNYCDFEKSLQHLQKMQLLPAIIVGVNGGFLDHILNNINHFLKADCVLYAPPIYGFAMQDKQIHKMELPFNTKISLLGIPSATITTKGLKWNLQQSNLTFPGVNSCFNRTAESAIEIEVHVGSLLILIYDEIASLKP